MREQARGGCGVGGLDGSTVFNSRACLFVICFCAQVLHGDGDVLLVGHARTRAARTCCCAKCDKYKMLRPERVQVAEWEICNGLFMRGRSWIAVGAEGS